MVGIRITIMFKTMADLTRRRHIIKDARGWRGRIKMTSLKFISIPSQPFEQFPSFVNISNTKIPMLQKSTGLTSHALVDYVQNFPLLQAITIMSKKIV